MNTCLQSTIPKPPVMSRNGIYFGSLEDQLVGDGDSSDMNVTGDMDNLLLLNNLITPTAPTNNTTANVPPVPTPTNDEFDRRALARSLRIPTDDPTVRRLLIGLNQPITLFGEGPAERRDRLRLMASRAICSLPRALELFPLLKSFLGSDTPSDGEGEEDDSEEFYVPGSIDLIKIRSFLLDDSIGRSRKRSQVIDHVTEHFNRTVLYEQISNNLDLKASLIDPQGRPISACTFTSNGDFYTGDWSGRVMEYPSDTPSNSKTFRTLQDRITALSSGGGVLLIGSATGKIELYNQNSSINHMCSIPSTHAIKSLNWHPSDRFFASCSSDSLWRLWDAQSGAELQVQEGHLGGVGAGTWHPDGAIYCTGGSTDGIIRIWDCRMGKSIWNIPCKPSVSITSLAFAPRTPNLLASSNADGLISLHDLRRVESEYGKVAAHRSCCSRMKFIADGQVLASSGFDGSVRLWCPGDLSLVKELVVASNGKVTDFDAFGLKVAAVTFDRSVKIFTE